jgi:hypothetical protein
MIFFARNMGKIESPGPFADRIFGISEKAKAEKDSPRTSRFLQKPCRTGCIPERPPLASPG